MQKIIIIIFLFSTGLSVTAQEDTYEDYSGRDELKTLSCPGTDNGGYASLNFGYGLIDDRGAFIAGFRTGWVINHSLTLGLGFNGFFNDLEDGSINDVTLAGGYGGLLIEPIIFPRSAIHLSIPVIAGIGAVASLQETFSIEGDPWGDYDFLESDMYFVIEPGLNLELSVARFMCLGLGLSYRFTENFNVNGVNTDALNSFSTNLLFKFGKF